LREFSIGCQSAGRRAKGPPHPEREKHGARGRRPRPPWAPDPRGALEEEEEEEEENIPRTEVQQLAPPHTESTHDGASRRPILPAMPSGTLSPSRVNQH